MIEASYSEDEVSFKASHAYRETKEVALYFSVNVWPVTADIRTSKGMINHVLFMDSLVPSVRIVAEDMPMEFGIPKCAILLMKRGKVFQSEEIMLPGNKKMRSLNVDENENYKYLGVLEAGDVKHSKMKDRIQKEYFRTVKTILNSIREIR